VHSFFEKQAQQNGTDTAEGTEVVITAPRKESGLNPYVLNQS
jgi:hypothetical protein